MTQSSLELGEHFAMRQPDGWSAFNACAETITHTPSLNWQDQAAILADETRNLSNETIDGYRYHYTGLLICELAQVLRDPAMQDKAVEAKVDAIARCRELYRAWHSFEQKAGLRIGEIRAPMSADPVGEIAVDRLPAAGRLALDVLKAARGPDIDTPADPEEVSDQLRCTEPNTWARKAANLFFTSASSITTIALRNLYNQGEIITWADVERTGALERFDPLVTDVIDPAEIKDLDLLQLAGQSAGIRMDELERLNEFLSTTADGKTYFDVSKRPKDPGEIVPGNVVVFHRKRFRCPALYVNGVIELALGLTATATETATRKFPLPATQ